MGIIFKEVENSTVLKKSVYRGSQGEFVHASIDITKVTLPFPNDYEYSACLVPKKFTHWSERIHSFKVHKDDIWIIGFPKSGTTWIQNIVWQLMNSLNFTATPKSAFYHLFENAAFLYAKPDDSELYKRFTGNVEKLFDGFDTMPSPRLFKSHLPAYLLPTDIWMQKPKIVYIMRDSKDVATSYYHMVSHDSIGFQRTFDDFCETFVNDVVTYTPFHASVLSYWQLRHFENILFLTYEQLVADPFNGIRQINDFLGYFYGDDQLMQLTEHLSFENMRKLNVSLSAVTIADGKQSALNIP